MRIKKLVLGVYFLQAFSLAFSKRDYDLIIIGAGAAGITAAHIARDLGKRVALLEKKMTAWVADDSGRVTYHLKFYLKLPIFCIKHKTFPNLV